jgi:uncharacterized protein YkwD
VIVVRDWLSSPGHRANIENCVYTRHGVGKAGTLWTHVFYTPAPGVAAASVIDRSRPHTRR